MGLTHFATTSVGFDFVRAQRSRIHGLLGGGGGGLARPTGPHVNPAAALHGRAPVIDTFADAYDTDSSCGPQHLSLCVYFTNATANDDALASMARMIRLIG